LRLATFVGLFVSLFSFVFVVIVLIRTLFLGDAIVGYSSMMAVILFLGGVQLLSLGIIGEYLGRIFNETKNRPLYFVGEYHASKIKNLTTRHADKFRFVMVGGTNTFIDFSILFALTSIGLRDITSNFISTSIALTFSFFANKMFTLKIGPKINCNLSGF
jgi:hypothetical protein